MAQIIIVDDNSTSSIPLKEGDRITISLKDGEVLVETDQDDVHESGVDQTVVQNTFVNSGSGETNYASGVGSVAKQVNVSTTQVTSQVIRGDNNRVSAHGNVRVTSI